MSYGWLTESSLLPKKSKSIKVDDQGSLFGLKNIVQTERPKANENNVSNRPIYKIKKTPSSNPGIERRIQNDQKAQISKNKSYQSQVVLKKKEEIYKQLQKNKRNVGKLLVDFSQKRYLNQQNDDFQANKELFYAGKLQQLKRQRQQVHQQQTGEKDLRQRLAWQKQVLGQLKGITQQKQKVRQVFDRKLDDQQKKALTQIRKQLSAQQKMIEEAKKRREQISAQRINKLKKLNIIKEKPQLLLPQTTKQVQNQLLDT